MDRLKGKVAVITGCSSGVGAVAAQKFAAEGAKVVISARRQQQLEEVAEKIRAAGGEVLPVVGDISKPEDAQALIDRAVEAYGTVDVLVNNAGVLDTGLRPIDRVLDADIDRVLDINTKGTMYCIRAALGQMEKTGKGSMAGTIGSDNLTGNSLVIFYFINFEILSSSKMLKYLSVIVSYCYFHFLSSKYLQFSVLLYITTVHEISPYIPLRKLFIHFLCHW